MRIKVDIFSSFGFSFLDLGVWIRFPIAHLRIYSTNASEEKYVQKKKHLSISDLYSDRNGDMVATF